MNDIVKRSGKVAFYRVGEVYHRMKGFTEFTTKKSPIEYSRQYIDEEFKRNDIVGYDTSISYAFDLIRDNAVHMDIVSVTDNEKTGESSIRNIVVADFTSGEGTSFSAISRDFALIPDSEGESTDAYTYSGSLKVSGNLKKGTVTSTDNFETCTFTED